MFAPRTNACSPGLGKVRSKIIVIETSWQVLHIYPRGRGNHPSFKTVCPNSFFEDCSQIWLSQKALCSISIKTWSYHHSNNLDIDNHKKNEAVRPTAKRSMTQSLGNIINGYITTRGGCTTIPTDTHNCHTMEPPIVCLKIFSNHNLFVHGGFLQE